jgi:predicted amidohydrolase
MEIIKHMKIGFCSAIMITIILFIINPAVCQERTMTFINANLISLDQDDVVPLQTVIVKGDRINAIGPVEEVIIPIGTTVIDATGSFLVPGLTDAHVHLDNKIGARKDFGDAPLYLAHGITTVFNMRGEAEHLDWKKRIQEGTLLAPNLYTAGEFVNEPRIETPEAAEQEVENHIRDGYDIIKFREVIDFEKHRILTTTGLDKPAYLRLNQAARRAAIPLVGHAPYNLGFDGLLEARQSLAHMNELANLYFLPPLELNRGMFMQMTKWSLIILIASILLWYMITILRRLLNRADIQESRQLSRFRSTTILVIFISSICFILWLLVVPPGFFFGKIWLLTLLSCLGLLVLILVIIAVIQAIKIWKESGTTIFVRIFVTLILLVSIGLCAGLTLWIPFAWRGSDLMIKRIVRDCKEAGIWVQSTLICQETFIGQKDGFRHAQIIQDPAFHYLPPPIQKSWREFADYKPPPITSLWKRHPEFNQRLTFALYREGVPLMAGTDAMGAPLIIPGISLHREMQLLLESGLSASEVLWTATVGPAKFLGKEEEFGTIEVGKRADLLLVEGNPLEDLNHLLKLKGVMVRGIWLPKDKLNQMLEGLLVKN